jgi:hypothetical protein
MYVYSSKLTSAPNSDEEDNGSRVVNAIEFSVKSCRFRR